MVYIDGPRNGENKAAASIIKFDDAFTNAGRVDPIVDVIIDAHIEEAITLLTADPQHSKKVTTSLLVLQGAGQQSDLVMYYKTGNCALYKKLVNSVDRGSIGAKFNFCLDVTVHDANLAKHLLEKSSDDNKASITFFTKSPTPYQFLLKQQRYVIVNTYLKLKDITINQNSTITITLEEV